MKPIISFSQGGAAARSRIALVRMLLVCVSLWTCSLMMSAQTEEIFFKESFQGVNGLESGVSPLDTADLDHPSGWILDRVHSGPQCALMESGGSITLPPVPEMTGNAILYVALSPWNNESYEPCKLEVSQGESSGSDLEIGVSKDGGYVKLYNVTPETRITVRATHDVRVETIVLQYGLNTVGMYTDEFQLSVPAGAYVEPFDVRMSPAEDIDFADNYLDRHMIMVYTTDGTQPTRFSTRYDGPIRVDTTTVFRLGLINEFGTLITRSNKYKYVFPVDVRNMADYRALPDNTFARLQLDDAVVTYSEITAGKGGDWYQYIYLRDATGAIGTEGYGSLPLHTGDVLGGSVVLYSRSDGGWSMSEYSSFDNLATDYREPEPVWVESVSELLDSCWLCQLVTLSGVTVSEGYARRDGASILLDKVSTMRTLFPTGNVPDDPEAEYDITGIVQPVYGGGFQLMAIDYPVLTGISGLAADAATPVAYYTTDGRRVSRPERGIYLVRYSDGKVRKVFFR